MNSIGKWLFATTVLAAALALADVPPADSMGCRDKAAGDVCKRDDGSSGRCMTEKCSRHDYSGGVPPKEVEYDCLKCAAAATTPPAPHEKKSCSVAPVELLALGLLLLRRRTAR